MNAGAQSARSPAHRPASGVPRFRLLPLFIVIAGLALALRLGGLWQGVEALAEDRKAAAMAAIDEADETEVFAADPFELDQHDLELLQALAERRKELEAHERDLEARGALLAAVENRIEEKARRLEETQRSIEALLDRYDEEEEEQLISLVRIYEAMKPRDAARIFEQLEMEVLLGVISRMRERNSAPILAEMSPEQAKAVTLRMAQRRDLPLPRD